jgi:hypothetical protein
MMVRHESCAACVALLALATSSFADRGPVVVGQVRVEPLSNTLVRIEQRGPNGFEDRTTFTVVERNWPGLEWTKIEDGRTATIRTPAYWVRVPLMADSLEGVQVLRPNGALLYQYKDAPPQPSDLPAPGQVFGAYLLGDSPRIVPPAWGATPTPVGAPETPTSGWDLANDAPDVYVFVNAGGGYPALRKEFLRLTGPTPMPPLFMFGFIDSRYHAYTQSEALGTIDKFRQKHIPLDVFVCDTDWRIGGSHGYAVNTDLFPNMSDFIAEAHKRGVRLMFNDHPEPVGTGAVDPKELNYRWSGLTKLLGMGMDVWWYDRNWGTHIQTPAPGLPLEVWGMRLYTEMTQRFRPNLRPVIMSNVWGINSGYRFSPTHPAAHRYPVWWTGDTSPEWNFLQMAIANCVDGGVLSLLPYINDDLGGFGGMPSPELYVRFLEYGSLCPVARVHCTMGADHTPWMFGEEAEKIVTQYIKLRYRLLPTIYAAARRCYDDGTPILRRCDLLWPSFKEAADSSQFLLGDDVLVAPVEESVDGRLSPVPNAALTTPDGNQGLLAEYFNNPNLEGKPELVRTDPDIDFNWGDSKPAVQINQTNFSVRWTGKIGPMPETGRYTFLTRSDDGVRLWIDGKLLVDFWVPQDNVTHKVAIQLEKGKTYDLRCDFCQFGGRALCTLAWSKPSEVRLSAPRTLWIPPGQWQDLWTGAVLAGPRRLTVESPLWHTPMYARVGGLVLLGPDREQTGSELWDDLALEAFVPSTNSTTVRELYRDDGVSLNYKLAPLPLYPKYPGGLRTPVKMVRSGNRVSILIAGTPMQGGFAGAVPNWTWRLRLHIPAGETVKSVKLNGRPTHDFVLTKPGKPAVGMGVMPFSVVPRRASAGGQILDLHANLAMMSAVDFEVVLRD